MRAFNKAVATIAAGWLFSLGQVQATVTITLDMNGLTPAPVGSTAIVLADSAGNGFGDLTFALQPSLSTSMWSPESDDLLLGVFAVGESGHLLFDVNFSLGGQLGQNDQLLVAWFPNLMFDPGLTGAGQGQLFGSYRDDLGGIYGTEADGFVGFTVPADGFGGTLFREAGMNGYPGQLLADQMTAVPEPTTAGLLLLGSLGLSAVLRRRKLS